MSNSTCYPKTALKHYMAGWTDAEESSVIEAHISECTVCEQTLAELEGEPETLVDFLQGNSKSSDHSQASDPLVGYALSKAKQLGTDRMVMEYIDGLDLSRLARAVHSLSIQDVCAIGQAMALGLDHAHAAGIVHRDIKPSNVMLSTSGQVKLLELPNRNAMDENDDRFIDRKELEGFYDFVNAAIENRRQPKP